MPDAFSHPVFRDPYGRMLRLCGRLETDEVEILAAVASLGEEVHTFVHREADSSEHFALFGSSVGGDKKHVHLDVVNPAYFADTPPEPTSSESRVAQMWKKFWGQRVNVNITGRFAAPLKKFAPDTVVTKLAAPRDVGGIQLRQTSASYEFSSGPFNGFSWFLSPDTEVVRAEVRLTLDEVINESYPQRMYDHAAAIFRTAVMGEKDDATR